MSGAPVLRSCLGCGFIWRSSTTACPRCPDVGEPLPDDHPEAIKDRYRRIGERNLEVFKKNAERVQ
jgi:hypothetical protein